MGAYREFNDMNNLPLSEFDDYMKNQTSQRIWTAEKKCCYFWEREFSFEEIEKSWDLERERERYDLYSGRDVREFKKLDRCMNWTNDTAFGFSLPLKFKLVEIF